MNKQKKGCGSGTANIPPRITKNPAKFPNPNAPTASGQVERLAFSIREVAIATGCCEKTVSLWIKDGLLRSTKVGNRVLISKEAIHDFLNGGTHEDASC